MKRLLIILVGFLLMAVNLYAADGDFIIDGNLGVGTLSPGVKLDISAPVANTVGRVYNTGSNGYYLHTKTPGVFAISSVSNGSTDGGGPHALFTVGRDNSNSSTFNIDETIFAVVASGNSGNVSIGTTNPEFSKLRVKAGSVGYGSYNRSLSVEGDNRTFVSLGIDETLGTYGRAWLTAAREGLSMLDILLAPEGGNVAIGTTDPQGYQLYVAGDAYSTVGWFSPSDIKFKENIEQIESPLDTILNIAGVSYTWKREEYHDKGFPEGRHYGVIAQEVQKVLPEIVKEGPSGGKAVAYSEIIPVLIEAIKEQHKIVQKQQKQITALKAEQQAMISALFEKVNELEKRMESQGTVALADY